MEKNKRKELELQHGKGIADVTEELRRHGMLRY